MSVLGLCWDFFWKDTSLRCGRGLGFEGSDRSLKDSSAHAQVAAGDLKRGALTPGEDRRDDDADRDG